MKGNTKLGTLLAGVGLLNALLFYSFITSQYNPIIDHHVAVGRADEGMAATITLAVLGWAGIATSGLWSAVLYGFIHKETWAWFYGGVASTIQILAGFFPAIPAMDAHLPTPTIVTFILAVFLWFSMLLIGGVEKRIIALLFVTGLAYVLTFVNGVAPIAKYLTTHGKDPFWNAFYVMSQQISWWAAIGWVVFILAVLAKKSWAIPVGIFAGTLAIVSGYPLGLHNALTEVHRFSMFLPGPIISTLVLIYLLLPGTRQMLGKWFSRNTPEEG